MKLVVPKKYIPKENQNCIFIHLDKEYCIINQDGIIYAIDNLCPHQGASLALGEIRGDEIICPLHQFRFHIKTGECNIQRFKVNTYTVEIMDEN